MPFLKYFKEPRSRILEEKTKKNGPRHAIFNIRGDKYVGEWKNNLKHGKGTYVSRNKLVYEGDWLNGKRHGYGVLSKIKDDGTQLLLYEGDWVNGKPEGVGRKHYEGDEYYEGEMKAGKRHGRGRMWYANGAFYDGQWADDKRHGEGLHVDAWGESYRGYWQAEQKARSKTVLAVSGGGGGGSSGGGGGDQFFRYEGGWRGDRRHGYGELYHLHSGQAQRGLWREGVAVCTDVRDINYRQASRAPTPYPIGQVALADAGQVHRAECERLLNERLEEETPPEAPPPPPSPRPSLSPWFYINCCNKMFPEIS